jgi:hypothetical protein
MEWLKVEHEHYNYKPNGQWLKVLVMVEEYFMKSNQSFRMNRIFNEEYTRMVELLVLGVSH